MAFGIPSVHEITDYTKSLTPAGRSRRHQALPDGVGQILNKHFFTDAIGGLFHEIGVSPTVYR